MLQRRETAVTRWFRKSPIRLYHDGILNFEMHTRKMKMLQDLIAYSLWRLIRRLLHYLISHELDYTQTTLLFVYQQYGTRVLQKKKQFLKLVRRYFIGILGDWKSIIFFIFCLLRLTWKWGHHKWFLFDRTPFPHENEQTSGFLPLLN